jgi:hypothetical protein
MRFDYLQKLNVWFAGQMATLKAEGMSDQELKDPAVADLILHRVFEEHFDELRFDQYFMDEVFAVQSDKSLPEDLRKLAIQAREQGNLEIGPHLELIADYREKRFTAEL